MPTTKQITAAQTTRKSLHTILDEAKIRGIEIVRLDLCVGGKIGVNKVTFAVREDDDLDSLAGFARALR